MAKNIIFVMADNLFSVGDLVFVTIQPPYLKTADSMPMLRPPDLITLGEKGTILEQKPGGYWAVRFERGSFLIDGRYIDRVAD
ncbi:MAG: DUF3148 domain-containing protein [Cyanobacteria bacterium P01_B01_bin.77]